MLSDLLVVSLLGRTNPTFANRSGIVIQYFGRGPMLKMSTVLRVPGHALLCPIRIQKVPDVPEDSCARSRSLPSSDSAEVVRRAHSAGVLFSYIPRFQLPLI
jgi:hypothetical protein